MRQWQAEDVPVSEVMRQHPHCVTEQQSVEELVSLFLDNGISSAPVMDNEGKPIGFVSKTDVVREIKAKQTGKAAEIVTEVRPWWDADRLSHLKVSAIMTLTVFTVSPSTTVANAAAAMAFEGMHHVPVVTDGGELVGMLSALDVLEWIARNAGYQPSTGQNGQAFERPT